MINYYETGINSPATINGGAGGNRFTVAGTNGVRIALNAGAGPDTVILESSAGALTVNGQGGTDTLVGPDTTTTWSISGTNAGSVGAVAFSDVEDLTGGSAEDDFVFSYGMGVAGKIDGGAGPNWLDYGLYTTAVTANLAADTATGASGGIANIRNIRGGAGNDTIVGNSMGNILIGGAGNDAITGGGGRSLLIGGEGNDAITGGSADDIVVGGYTDYDASGPANDLALEALLAEWQAGDPYATRVSKITAGIGGARLAYGTTVHDDGNTSTLAGGGGIDWFFRGSHDSVTDLAPTEQID